MENEPEIPGAFSACIENMEDFIFAGSANSVTLALLRPYIICLTRGSNSQPHYDTLALLRPYIICLTRGSNSQPHYDKQSLPTTTLPILCNAPGLDSRTASHLGASCISSPLYDPYLASCSSHVLLMTRTRPIGYDPLI